MLMLSDFEDSDSDENFENSSSCHMLMLSDVEDSDSDENFTKKKENR